MYCTIEAFISDWKSESESTLKILQALTDKSPSQKVTTEDHSLGFFAWHLVLTLGEMGKQVSLDVCAPAENTPPPSNASMIAATYESAARSLTDEVKRKWSDQMLDDDVPIYGETWKRRAVLASIIKHEIHHRAQMTVLMRQAGLKVPGVYGPSKEEWAALGMPPMK